MGDDGLTFNHAVDEESDVRIISGPDPPGDGAYAYITRAFELLQIILFIQLII